MERLSLRFRIFLFFVLVAVGALASLAGGLWLGHSRVGGDIEGYAIAGLVAGFGILGCVAGIWLLFDENVAKPITRIAAELRSRAHGSVSSEIDGNIARYLGDLAPAAAAVSGRLGEGDLATAERIASETARLTTERERLAAALSEIPVAVLLMTDDHKISLYDGQAAIALDTQGPLCLGHSIFDYVERGTIVDTLEALSKQDDRSAKLTVKVADGSKDFSATLRVLDGGTGYLLALETEFGAPAPRPLVFDFEFLKTDVSASQGEAALDELIYVVFDLETTGLEPHRDEVVQIGAVRLMGGRRIDGEDFDLLVDPGRAIPASSTKIHGITDEMVRGAPRFPEAVVRFQQFAKNAVLVAHNAPFDMAFLRKEAKTTGVEFKNAVLDTVLLSAVLYGPEARHTLDAIAERLDVEIPARDRHTALGDALATSAILEKIIPILIARGIKDLNAAHDAMKEHSRLLRLDGN